MENIIYDINSWLCEILSGVVKENLVGMFLDVNEKVGGIAAEVGKTPKSWNESIFDMIQTLSENAILPVAGMILTFVLCYELIAMITETNNMHTLDGFMFFKWFLKAGIAVFILSHTFDITIAVFDLSQYIVARSGTVISTNTNINIGDALLTLNDTMYSMELPELLLLVLETTVISFAMKIISIIITVILYGRMVEIYAYCSLAPIPFATFANREWGSIGQNYIKGLLALGLQGFLIMVCVAIYSVLVNNMVLSDNIHTALFSVAAYTVLLCCTMLKSGGLAKSILNAG